MSDFITLAVYGVLISAALALPMWMCVSYNRSTQRMQESYLRYRLALTSS